MYRLIEDGGSPVLRIVGTRYDAVGTTGARRDIR